MDDRSQALRQFFARYVAAQGRTRDPRIERAFAFVAREPFAGPGPWSINLPGIGSIKTPNDDPAFLYQDTLIVLDAARGVNIGMPSAHAMWLDALAPQTGEHVLQVGVGTGYYTSILAFLVGETGFVHAFEIDAGLAARARENTKHLPQVVVQARSGIAADLPDVDAIYVCAGITQPSLTWIDALRPGGRLVFPLQPVDGLGGMLLIRRAESPSVFPAHFISRAAFIGCVGLQDEPGGRRLQESFARKDARFVRSFRTDAPVDETCWFSGEGWWLSTAEPDR